MIDDQARLYLSDKPRKIYFKEKREAVLKLEKENREAAKIVPDSLPLVKAGKLKIDILELKPNSGYFLCFTQ
jgi:hypothetical protein